MKMVFTADTHFGQYPYGWIDQDVQMNSRMLDLFENFDVAVDFAIDNKADIFLHCGDVYKLRSPRNIERKEFLKRVKKLMDNKIYFIVVLGNHDVSTNLHNLDFVEFGLDYVEVVDEPRRVVLRVGSIETHILCIPWARKSSTEKLGSSQGLLKKMSKQLKGDINVLACHGHISEAKMGATDFVLFDENNISLKELVDLNLDAICLGHIHKAQTLSASPFVGYAGSIGKIDFGEMGESKGFYFMEFE